MGTRHKAGAQQGSGKRLWLFATITVESRPCLVLSLVRIRETFGHDRRSRGDDQGDGEHDLLHQGSPLSVGRFDLGSTGWPNLPSEREIIGLRAPFFPIAFSYGLGALRVELDRSSQPKEPTRQLFF